MPWRGRDGTEDSSVLAQEQRVPGMKQCPRGQMLGSASLVGNGALDSVLSALGLRFGAGVRLD